MSGPKLGQSSSHRAVRDGRDSVPGHASQARQPLSAQSSAFSTHHSFGNPSLVLLSPNKRSCSLLTSSQNQGLCCAALPSLAYLRADTDTGAQTTSCVLSASLLTHCLPWPQDATDVFIIHLGTLAFGGGCTSSTLQATA